MTQTRRRFLSAFSAVAAVALTGSVRQVPMTRHRFHALGTIAQITLAGRSKQAEAALMACQMEVAAIEKTFSLYDTESMLSQLNRDGSVTPNSLFRTLLQYALAMAEATNGAFDLTVQPYWKSLAAGGDPEPVRRHIGWRGLHLTAETVQFTRPQMAASFNGIAQGFAADRVKAILAQHGFEDTLVDLGEFAAAGAKYGRPWRLGIQDPLTRRIVANIEPAAGAIATSEPSGTLVAGQPHIIDPLNRLGERWTSVTVEAREAWRADALSTAIAASPVQAAEGLLAAGGATRGWLIPSSGVLQQWRAHEGATNSAPVNV